MVQTKDIPNGFGEVNSTLVDKVKQMALKEKSVWENVGQQVGLEIWRIENFQVVPWPKEQYGKFFSGDSYIVLNTYKKNPSHAALSYDVHFWLGCKSSKDEWGTAAYKTVEIDDCKLG